MWGRVYMTWRLFGSFIWCMVMVRTLMTKKRNCYVSEVLVQNPELGMMRVRQCCSIPLSVWCAQWLLVSCYPPACVAVPLAPQVPVGCWPILASQLVPLCVLVGILVALSAYAMCCGTSPILLCCLRYPILGILPWRTTEYHYSGPFLSLVGILCSLI